MTHSLRMLCSLAVCCQSHRAYLHLRSRCAVSWSEGADRALYHGRARCPHPWFIQSLFVTLQISPPWAHVSAGAISESFHHLASLALHIQPHPPGHTPRSGRTTNSRGSHKRMASRCHDVTSWPRRTPHTSPTPNPSQSLPSLRHCAAAPAGYEASVGETRHRKSRPNCHILPWLHGAGYDSCSSRRD